MKNSSYKVALILSFPIALAAFGAFAKLPTGSTAVSLNTTVYQGSALDARLLEVEKRINILKQSVSTKPQFKQHRGTVATLENRKNSLKAQIKTGPKNNASRPQLEQEMKALEDKLSELESQVK
jgi:hypothetical protein